ncbi:MAG: SET domain-containing protein-lysine N-methyltransferase [Taibaiella sp.]|nr:SET domain-containing protein-lysine N-methyltransferase [Taibaiella sp.]
MIHPDLYIKTTDNKGRGIFTTSAIPADTIVEEAPVIVMTPEERPLLDKTLLHDYIFEWKPDGALMCCMALGHIPIYNHSYSSNCEYFMDYESEMMQIKTVRDIAEEEELTINYNGDWNDEKPVWFDVKE